MLVSSSRTRDSDEFSVNRCESSQTGRKQNRIVLGIVWLTGNRYSRRENLSNGSGYSPQRAWRVSRGSYRCARILHYVVRNGLGGLVLEETRYRSRMLFASWRSN